MPAAGHAECLGNGFIAHGRRAAGDQVIREGHQGVRCCPVPGDVVLVPGQNGDGRGIQMLEPILEAGSRWGSGPTAGQAPPRQSCQSKRVPVGYRPQQVVRRKYGQAGWTHPSDDGQLAGLDQLAHRYLGDSQALGDIGRRDPLASNHTQMLLYQSICVNGRMRSCVSSPHSGSPGRASPRAQ